MDAAKGRAVDVVFTVRNIDQVAIDDRRKGFSVNQLLDCKMSGIDVIDILTFFEREAGKIRIDMLNPSWLVFSDGFEHRLGYSIGIGFPPDWGEGRIMSINENDPLVLEAGMCFHYIPDLKIPHQGGVVFSESLVVTDTGYELLSDYPRDIVFR